MKTKLTKTLVDKLSPKDRAYEVYDTELQGLLIRVQPQGQKNWYLRYRLPTGRRRIALGSYAGLSPEGARVAAKKYVGEVAIGVDVQERKHQQRIAAGQQKASALGTFVSADYGSWCRAHLKAGAAHLERLEADFEAWWSLPMAQITPARIDDWRKNERLRGASPRTVNRNLSRLRSALAKAVEWGLLTTNPMAGVKPLRFDKTLRVRYLNEAQEAALFAALEDRERRMREERARYNQWRSARGLPVLPVHPEPYADYLRPLVVTVRNTGLRRSEALTLRWANVDLAHKVITVAGARSKTQQTRRIPLNSKAQETLEAWRQQLSPQSDDEYVFGSDPQEGQLRIDAAWRGVRKAAGLADLRFHDLRHHFASKLVQKGTDLNTVRELLGHASIDMTLAYAHLAPEGLAAAVERIA